MRSPPRIAAGARLSPKDREDFLWCLQRDYEGDVGVRSNLGPMVSRLELRTQSAAIPIERWTTTLLCSDPPAWRDFDPSDAVLEAACRLNRLDPAWRRLSVDDVRTLGLHLVGDGVVLPEWGDVGALIPETNAAQTAYRAAKPPVHFLVWLSKATRTPLEPRARAEAEARLSGACRAWERALDSTRRRRRAS